jgi:hypothetical protein
MGNPKGCKGGGFRNRFPPPRPLCPVRAFLLAALLLAGCLSPPAAPAGPAAATGPATHAWGLSECAFAIARVAVPAAALQPLLPEGFAPAPSDLPGVAGAPGAELHLDAYVCKAGVGLDGSPLQEVQYGSYYVPAIPPAALKEPGYDAYFVKLQHLVPDAARREALAAGGLPALNGSATVTSLGPRWTARLALGGAGGFSLDGVAQPANPQGAPLPFIEYTPLAKGGLARWHARLHDATLASGDGVLRLAPGKMRDLVGADEVPVRFLAGTWNLDHADVTFPLPWPR